MAAMPNLGMGLRLPVTDITRPLVDPTGGAIALVTGDTALGSSRGETPYRIVPTTTETRRVEGTLPTRYGPRGAPQAPEAMAVVPEPASAAPRAPVAPRSAPGGMGGLGGMGGTIGDAMQALGASMMTGQNGNWTGSFAQNMDALQGRRAQEAERATQMQAMQGALVELGFSPDEAAQYAGTPEAAQLVLQAREQARTRAERERMLSGAREAEAALRSGGAPAPTQGAGAFPAIGSPEALGLPSGAFGESGAQPAPAAAPAPAPMPGASLPPEWEDANRKATQYGALAAQFEAADDPVNAARMTSLAQEYEARRDLIAQRMPSPQGPTALSQLYAELDALPEGDPRRLAFEQRIAREISGQQQQSRVIFGPDGAPILIEGEPSIERFTEAQSKDNVFSTRARGALEVLDGMVGEGDAAVPLSNALTSRMDRLGNLIPLGFGREFQSDDFQVAEQAGQEFLQAILRKDTGAAITIPEQELYGVTYLPQPGDGPAVLEAKAQARRRAILAIEAGMSPSQMLAQERALQAAEQEAVQDTPSPAGGVSPDVEEILRQYGVQ